MTRLVPFFLIAMGLTVLVSSARGQEPIQPTPPLDTTQIQQLPDLQSTPSGPLILPDSVLQTLRPERITRIGQTDVGTDTSVVPGGQDLSINTGEVVVLSEGSSFQKVASPSAVRADSPVVASSEPATDPAEDDPPPQAEAPEVATLPVYRAPIRVLSNPSSGSPSQGRLLMRSLQDGFVMTERPSIFETTLQIWLESDAGMGPIPLASPVETIVSAEDAVSVDSSPFTLEDFNDIVSVHVRAQPQRDSLTVSVRLPAQSSPPRAVLGVRRPELRVSASPTRIEGFGLGESTVQVQVPGSYPSPASLSAATQAATAEPTSQEVRPGTTGRFTIRSWGVGEETIRIQGGPFADAGRTVRVDFIWPIYFILFALAGSLVGGGIRYYRRRSSAAERPVRLPGILASGLLIGVVGAMLYAIGVSLFPFIPAGETGQAVVFVVSAAAAVSGPNLPFEDTAASA